MTEPRSRDGQFHVGTVPLQWTEVAVGIDDSVGWQHSGVAELPDGSLLFAHPDGGDLIRLDNDGKPARLHTELTEMHCLTVGRGAQNETIVWTADNGHRFVPHRPHYAERTASGRAVALDAAGSVVRELTAPPQFGPWSPTSIAVTDPYDPDSDIWVADGYGQNLVHRFSPTGALQMTLDGANSGKHFDCPHGILIRSCVEDGRTVRYLYVADRSNARIVVFDLHGDFVRTVGEGSLSSPSSMIDYAGHLVVTELFGSIALFEGDLYESHVGASTRDPDEAGWPNELREDSTVAPILVDGVFNSPHGIALYRGGIAITEWVIGGRVIALLPVVKP